MIREGRASMHGWGRDEEEGRAGVKEKSLVSKAGGGEKAAPSDDAFKTGISRLERGALAALPEDPSSFPTTYMRWLTMVIYSSSSMGFNAFFFCLQGHQAHMCVVHRYTHANKTSILKNNF